MTALGDDRNGAAGARKLNPVDWGLPDPMSALRRLALGHPGGEARLVLEPGRPQRDRQTNGHSPSGTNPVLQVESPSPTHKHRSSDACHARPPPLAYWSSVPALPA